MTLSPRGRVDSNRSSLEHGPRHAEPTGTRSLPEQHRRGTLRVEAEDRAPEPGGGLYRTFGDEHTLFLRALDHYRATDSAEARERLLRPGPAPEALREWLVRMVDLSDEGDAARGCFVVNTATELGADDPAVDERTQAAFGVTRDALRELLERGRRDGEPRADLDVAATADTLFTLVLGLRVRARAGHGAGELTSVIDTAVRSLR